VRIDEKLEGVYNELIAAGTKQVEKCEQVTAFIRGRSDVGD